MSRTSYAAVVGVALVATYAIKQVLKKTGPWTGGQKADAALDQTVAASFPASDPPPF